LLSLEWKWGRNKAKFSKRPSSKRLNKLNQFSWMKLNFMILQIEKAWLMDRETDNIINLLLVIVRKFPSMINSIMSIRTPGIKLNIVRPCIKLRPKKKQNEWFKLTDNWKTPVYWIWRIKWHQLFIKKKRFFKRNILYYWCFKMSTIRNAISQRRTER
jgi:hypothetical protein